ncbi:MAG: hypothetical protein JWP08_4311 [Bryobacterales bacterium]|jgi:hypothetical protein|nr:hypothetical protein [Bryobacterales bacterium]
MKHLSLKMEKLEERIAPGGLRFGNSGSKSHGSKSHQRSRSHGSKSRGGSKSRY